MVVLFAVGGGGDPERHRPLLDAVADRGARVIAPRFERLLPQAATGLDAPLRERGFEPVPVDLSELHKAGGSVKCCTMELRPATP